MRNKSERSQVRSTIRRFLEAVGAGDQPLAQEQFLRVTRLIDSAAHKGVYHKNTVARTKSRLQKKLNTLAS